VRTVHTKAEPDTASHRIRQAVHNANHLKIPALECCWQFFTQTKVSEQPCPAHTDKDTHRNTRSHTDYCAP
jgi:hypothetical protein